MTPASPVIAPRRASPTRDYATSPLPGVRRRPVTVSRPAGCTQSRSSAKAYPGPRQQMSVWLRPPSATGSETKELCDAPPSSYRPDDPEEDPSGGTSVSPLAPTYHEWP